MVSIQQKMKTVYFHYHAPRIHSLYRSLFKYPPEEYMFIYEEKKEGVQALNRSKIVWWVNVNILKHVVSTVAIKDFLGRFKQINADLIYSSGYIVYKKQPWVIDLEYASCLTGYDNKLFLKKRKQILKSLLSPECKAILPWNEWCKQTLLNSIDHPELRKKIHVVPVAIEPPTVNKSKHEKITLLFVGSANLPKDFYHKGGKAALRVYKHLKKHYDIRLIMRCAIPEELHESIEEFRQDPDIEIIDKILSVDELNDVFARSDILISPTITTPILVYLDAMGREIPVVTTDAWANAEIVTHGETGIVVEKPDIPYYEKDMLPIPMWYWKESKNFDHDSAFIDRFCKGVQVLLEDPKLIKKYGARGRIEITEGKFSLQKRNEALKKIFDDAIGKRI